MKQWSDYKFPYTFALMLITTAVFGLYIWLAAQRSHFGPIEPMVNGTASRPYVYRVLTPFIVRVLSGALELSLHVSVVFVIYLSMLGFSWSIVALARIYIPTKYMRRFTLLAPIGLIPFLIEQRHIYDFPTLFLFTLALLFLAKAEFINYILVFVLATLSKETSFFLIVFFAIQFREIERRKYLSFVFVQVVIYTLVRLALILLFRNNPGNLLELHLNDHINAYIQNPLKTIILFSVIVCLIWICKTYTIDKSNFIRNSFIAIGSPTLLLYFFFGMPFEVRIFLETYPSMFMIISLTLTHFIRCYTNSNRLNV